MTLPRPNNRLRVEAIGWNKQVRVPVTDEMHDRLRRIASELDTSIAEIVRVAIKDWIEANCKEIKKAWG